MDEKQKILIVDDRKENLVALRQVLSGVDVEIVEATSGNQALTMTIVHDFSLAILDVRMPGMDGFELAGLLRGDPKTAKLPVIFVTAVSGQERDVFKGYEAGAVDYIVKPYSPAVLVAKVRVFLELQAAKRALARRILELSASEERYRTLVATIPDIVYRIDGEGRFTFLNDAVRVLGYGPEELMGVPFAEIVLPADLENVSRRFVLPRFTGKRTGLGGAPKLFDERRRAARKTVAMEVRLVSRSAGQAVPGELHSGGRPVLTAEVNSSGLYAGTEEAPPTFLGSVGVIRDVSQRKASEIELTRYRRGLERMVREQTAQLEERILEKEVLLKEVHHRVKNNMQVMSTLLMLQGEQIREKEVADLFQEACDRIKSMALIHEMLYRSEDFAKVDMARYFEALAAGLFRFYGIDLNRIRFESQTASVHVEMDTAIPCGLMANELISNALKHAFPGEAAGRIRLSMRSLGEEGFELSVSDDGVGLPEDLDMGKTESLGLRLVRMLAEDQLHGRLVVDRTGGTRFTARFKGKMKGNGDER